MSNDPVKEAYASCPECYKEYRGISYESREHANKAADRKVIDCQQRHRQAEVKRRLARK